MSSPSALLIKTFAATLAVATLPSSVHTEETNWLRGNKAPGTGTFELTMKVPYPWHGVDEEGYLRKAVAVPGAHPFISKSNEFTYAWLGTSASFVDMDGDGLPDIISPDGNGIFWFWKNIGQPGAPAFGRGESMPLIIDDLRSEFAPIFEPAGGGAGGGDKKPALTGAQEAAKRRIDERREREFEQLKRRNDRAPRGKKVDEKELRKQVEQENPYPWEVPLPGGAGQEVPQPANRLKPGEAIPPGGLVCMLNSFRRLRLAASVGDLNGDGLPDIVAGDSSGAVYAAWNIGQQGRPHFSLATRAANAIPLKVAPSFDYTGRQTGLQRVDFLNYATPFLCDWDGDNTPDLLLGEGTYSVNAIRLFPNVARATLQNPPKETHLYFGDDRTFLSPFAADYDGDGALDLFVCDDKGRVTWHRREGAGLAEPRDLQIENGAAHLAYACPQPCDWNGDGIMDLIWGERYGRIMVSLGKTKGGLDFSAPAAVGSKTPAEMITVPLNVSLAAVPARVKDAHGGFRNGGTANAERFFMADGTQRTNTNGWPENMQQGLHGLLPPWSADSPPSLESQLLQDGAGKSNLKHASWGIAPIPGDIWEVVGEMSAPGEGNTLLLRWHDISKNAVFKSPAPRLPQWTRGASIAFLAGRSGPFCEFYTKKSITIKFQMKLDGVFSRLDVQLNTNWGPLRGNGKPPVEGGDFSKTLLPPPTGRWFEFSHTEPPHAEHQRGLDGVLFIGLIGEGEVRIRDVKILEAD